MNQTGSMGIFSARWAPQMYLQSKLTLNKTKRQLKIIKRL